MIGAVSAVAQEAAPKAPTAPPLDAATTVQAKPEAPPTNAKAAPAGEAAEQAKQSSESQPSEKTSEAEAGKAADAPAQTEASTAAAVLAAGNEDEEATPRVEAPGITEAPSNGSYTRRIGIEVPKYHGIEPDLGLRYDSNGGIRAGGLNAGLVGVGWKLLGVPDIVRTVHGGGAPTFSGSLPGTSDTFELDGREMFRCSSPNPEPAASCLTGGDFATRVENFLKVKYTGGTSNTWTVYAKDGTRFVFEPMNKWANEQSSPIALRASYRWLLSQVIDTVGNTVTYSYQCGETPLCDPFRIEYNKTRIDFKYDEAAPSERSFATGLNVPKTKSLTQKGVAARVRG